MAAVASCRFEQEFPKLVMANSLYLSTTDANSGKATIALGILEFVLRKTPQVGFFRPLIAAPKPGRQDDDIALMCDFFDLPQSDRESYGMLASEASDLVAQDRRGEVFEQIIARYKALEQRCDFILCEGSDYIRTGFAFEFDLNMEIAENLGCPVLVLGNGEDRSLRDTVNPVEIAIDAYRDRGCSVVGTIVNKADPEQIDAIRAALELKYKDSDYLLAAIPHDRRLSSPTVGEIAAELGADILHGRAHLDCLVYQPAIAAMQIHNALHWLREVSLIVTPGDRDDIIVSMLQAHHSRSYPNLAGILLSGGIPLDPAIARLLQGLSDVVPILSVKTDTYTTATNIARVGATLRPGDRFKIDLAIQLFDRHVHLPDLDRHLSAVRTRGMTAKMFAYTLEDRAAARPQHIVLPEGSDPRILKAAAALLARGAVRAFTLLGKPEEIEQAIAKLGLAPELAAGDRLRIVDPGQSPHFESYVRTFHELRARKGVTLESARDYMLDVSYFGTMMVYLGDADGMVSGAAHTTQHTIRPALQIVKTVPEVAVVSSVFFMCVASRVLVYADCAINPNPNSEQLADIAVSSAATAQAFGVEPRVALLSYSSGTSGKGEDVEKVRKATELARSRRPDLLLEGPLQYDAAVDPEVAAHKLPDSAVAGKATVFVFPDLNTGNNTYKAVQRETGALAIGPILQGLRKPVNDLSRGCTIEDVKNTILITAIQAQLEQTGRVAV